MRFAIVQFPGTTGHRDVRRVLRDVLAQDSDWVWHLDTELGNADAVILPGGSSFGDALRCGAIAAYSPILRAVQEFAQRGGIVLGIGNGFQILCETGLLPGALIRNPSLRYRCASVPLRTVTRRSAFTRAIPGGRVLRLPIAHAAGCYVASPETLSNLQARDQILWEYAPAPDQPTPEPDASALPYGSHPGIAGICNDRRNVAGLMPHPERACEAILGSDDGRLIFESVLAYLQHQLAAKAA